MQLLLKLPASLSYVTKRHLWRSTYTKGFPSAPLCLGDAQAILDFYHVLEEAGVDQLTISCEYGKSRSVTTASFLQEHIQHIPGTSLPYPNKWMKDMLEIAKEKDPKASVMSEDDLKKIERYKHARLEFFKNLEEFGGTLHAREVAALLSISETAVVGQVNSDTLIGLVSSESQEYLIPAFQFEGGQKLPHLEELLKALGKISDVGACTWFLNEIFELHGCPADIIRAGASQEQLQALLRDATHYGTPVAS